MGEKEVTAGRREVFEIGIDSLDGRFMLRIIGLFTNYNTLDYTAFHKNPLCLPLLLNLFYLYVLYLLLYINLNQYFAIQEEERAETERGLT